MATVKICPVPKHETTEVWGRKVVLWSEGPRLSDSSGSQATGRFARAGALGPCPGAK